MHKQSVCFTGHRHIERGEYARLSALLSQQIDALYERGFRHFYAGGAIGFDTAAALAVIDFKKSHADAQLCLMLPCKNQAAGWSASARRTYEQIISLADSVSYACENYVTGCMQLRNRKLVDSAAVCVCYLKGAGGTAYTVKYAAEQGLEIINLA